MKCIDPLKKSSCGCCELPDPATPEVVGNRPGLNVIGYRVGTYASFRQAMMQAISRHPELKGNAWTAQTSDDYGVVLIEMWAYLADILTFYQERIASEAYLRTAILPESVRWMAGLLDYKLSPGAAASVHLAFTLEKGRQVKIPAGLRVQSVPGQDEEPQKFETIEAVDAIAGIDKVKIFPMPQPFNPLAEQGTYGYLESKSSVLKPKDNFVIFSENAPGDPLVEEKVVESLRQEGEIVEISWKPGIKSSERKHENSRAFKLLKKYRHFGYNAPEKYHYSYPDENNNIKWVWIAKGTTEVNGEPIDYAFKLSSRKTLDLDGVYDDLKVGSKILILIGKDPDTSGSTDKTILTTVEEVHRVSVSYGPLNATVSRITVKDLVPEIDNIREVEIYSLEEPEIEFLEYLYPEEINGDIFCIPSITARSIAHKRTLILDDENANPVVVAVSGINDLDEGPSKTGLASIAFDPALNHPLNRRTAFLYGNVAFATHGQTVKDEVLGDGDASLALQSFLIGNPRVTQVDQPTAPHGLSNTLRLRVDGILWHEVNSFYGRSGDERVYTTEIDDDARMTIRFGDGINGARLPSGSGNVTATYRKGLGRDGNVKTGSLKILLGRPVGLKSVVNPAGAQGGGDPEEMEDARRNAPNTIRTFERIVSLRDFEDAAREFEGRIAKAKSSWRWDGEEQSVLLTVAAKDDAITDNNDPLLDKLVSYLNDRRDLNRKLRVKVREKVPIAVEAEVKIDPDFVDEDIQEAAASALLNYLSFDNLDLGQAIHLSDLYFVLQTVEGVIAARITKLGIKGLSPSDILEKHIFLKPDELATVEDPGIDIRVELWSSDL